MGSQRGRRPHHPPEENCDPRRPHPKTWVCHCGAPALPWAPSMFLFGSRSVRGYGRGSERECVCVCVNVFYGWVNFPSLVRFGGRKGRERRSAEPGIASEGGASQVEGGHGQSRLLQNTERSRKERAGDAPRAKTSGTAKEVREGEEMAEGGKGGKGGKRGCVASPAVTNKGPGPSSVMRKTSHVDGLPSVISSDRCSPVFPSWASGREREGGKGTRTTRKKKGAC